MEAFGQIFNFIFLEFIFVCFGYFVAVIKKQIKKMSSSRRERKEEGNSEGSSEGKKEDANNEEGKKSNSTSSIYIKSTMSVPDNDEIMFGVSSVLQFIMLAMADKEVSSKFSDDIKLFDEDHYRESSRQKGLRGRDCLPEVETIFKFYSCVFAVAQFSPESNLISLVYVNRLINFTSMKLHGQNWRIVCLLSLLLAQKVWDDKCLANVDFPSIWSHAVPGADNELLNLRAINVLELTALRLLQYDLHVSSSLYAKYYFEVRTLYDKNQKAKGKKKVKAMQMKPLTKVQARRLEARSDSMGNTLHVEAERKAKSFMLPKHRKSSSKSRAVLS